MPPRRSSRTLAHASVRSGSGAEDYADDILNTLEVNLSKFISAVQRGRDRLQGKDEDEPAEVVR